MLKYVLGGIPMIADDMMGFIKNDIVVLTRYWSVCINTNSTSVIIMIGLLGFFEILKFIVIMIKILFKVM